jgi:hypothetical protein
MSKLETQINQIFLSPADSKKLSLILYEEKISNTHQLFLIAELKGIQRRTEVNDLGKISEIIIESFKTKSKLPTEAMFENTLAEINQKLADFAHKGRKSWLGKFSALIAIKSDRDFYLANTGLTCAWLKRKNELNEILEPEKNRIEPLKTFVNFSSGRLIDEDSLILSTSSLFNYISLELFSKTLNSNSLQEACTKISQIIKGSAKSDEGFAAFMLKLTKQLAPAPIAPKQTVTQAAAPTQPIYAPLPEEWNEESAPAMSMPSFPSISRPSLPKLNFKLPNFKFSIPGFPKLNIFPNISGPAKFFLASFILFAVLFAMNIAAFGLRKAQSAQKDKFNGVAETLVNYLAEAESSLLYRNQSQAMKLMSSAETELHKLQQLDSKKSVPFQAKFEEMNNKINRVTVLRNLTPALEMPYPITFMERAGSGYLVANENPNSLGVFTDNNLKNLFMLNKTDGDLRGVAHVSGQGNFVASRDKIYLASQTSQEFEQRAYISNAELHSLKYSGPNRLYAINKTTNQVIRMTASANSVTGVQNILRVNANLVDAQDLAVDSDVYILFPDKIVKYTNGQPVDFVLSPLSEPAKQMTKLRVGNQIYVLEPVAKRVLIYTRKGELLNQVQFPDLTDLKDIYVDEAKREMLLMNGNKTYRITF